MSDFPWLTVLIGVPLVGALVAWSLLPAPGPALPKLVALGVSILTLAVAVAIAAQYETGGGMQLTETHEWIERLRRPLRARRRRPRPAAGAAHRGAGADRDRRLVARRRRHRQPAAFFAWALALEGLSLAVFTATDVFLFYVVFEATLIPAYFLIGGFGREAGRWPPSSS